MVLRCPHCDSNGEHVPSRFYGDWVACPSCELPFAWRDVPSDGERADDVRGNGANSKRQQFNPQRGMDR